MNGTTRKNSNKEDASRILTVDWAERKVREYQGMFANDDETYEEKLYELVDLILEQKQVVGTDNSFHNFALNFSRRDDSLTACEILDKGLLLFPNNTDLLADYLQMGSECGLFDRCAECFKQLMSIRYDIWTWRAFSFSIDYLLLLCTGVGSDIQLNELKSQALNLVQEYRKQKPEEEGSFCSEADIYVAFNMHQEKIKILKAGIEACPSSPKCSLRLADILFDQGDYQEARNVLQRLTAMVGSQERVNRAYVYYLLGLSKYALCISMGDYSEETVMDIYDDFSIAFLLKLQSDAYRSNMRKCIKILEKKSKKEYPEDSDFGD